MSLIRERKKEHERWKKGSISKYIAPHLSISSRMHDPTEVAIQKMIEASQRMIKVNSQGEPGGGMSLPIKKRLELEIKILENAPRDADKLTKLLQVKQRQKEKEADHIEDTQRLVTEIEMLKVVLYLVSRNRG